MNAWELLDALHVMNMLFEKMDFSPKSKVSWSLLQLIPWRTYLLYWRLV